MSDPLEELSQKIIVSLGNLFVFLKENGYSISEGMNYENGRYDTYITVLGWIKELQQGNE